MFENNIINITTTSRSVQRVNPNYDITWRVCVIPECRRPPFENHLHVTDTNVVWFRGGRFKNAYELLNLRAFKITVLYKNHIFQCMGKIFCVEFQMVPLKFHTKYLTHTLKYVDFIHRWKFESSYIQLLFTKRFEVLPPDPVKYRSRDMENYKLFITVTS